MNRDEGIIYVLRKGEERAVTNDTVTDALRGDYLGNTRKPLICVQGVFRLMLPLCIWRINDSTLRTGFSGWGLLGSART